MNARRLISLTLSLALMAGLVPVPARAVEATPSTEEILVDQATAQIQDVPETTQQDAGEPDEPVEPQTIQPDDQGTAEESLEASEAVGEPAGAAAPEAASEPDAEAQPAEEPQGATGDVTLDVVRDYGAKGDGVTDDGYAIRACLRRAASLADGATLTVTFPAGTYLVNSYLLVYSNTHIILDEGASVIAGTSFGNNGSGTLLGGVHLHNGSECDGTTNSLCNRSGVTPVGGYNQVQNIVIEGGAWDRNAQGTCQGAVFRFNHGKNITIRDTTILHASDHFFNLSGCRDVTVQWVTFKDFNYGYIKKAFGSKNYQNEAIHYDSMQSVGEAGAFPQDGTAAQNVKVLDCSFANIADGVGTHHFSNGTSTVNKSRDITVRGCTFANLSGRCVNIYCSDNTVVENCTATNCAALAVTRDETCTIRNNAVRGTKVYNSWDEGEGIKAVDSRGATITGNTILNTTSHGISVARTQDPATSKATIKGNTVIGVAGAGSKYDINVGSSCIVTVQDNNIGIRGYKNWKNAKSKETASGNSTKAAADKWRRLYGSGRYDTMKAIVDAGFSAKGGTVVVATGAGFKDALAAAGLAGLDGAPVILTGGSSLNAAAKAELVRLKPTKVYVAGGTMAVSNDVMRHIESACGVRPKRIAGNNSAETSAKLAQEGKGRWGDTAVIATNKTFKDALSVAPVAYAKHWPILLADNGRSLNPMVIAALKDCGIKQVIIVGGTAAVTGNVESQLIKAHIDVKDRWAGKTGTATSAKIATEAIKLGLSANKMGIATSQNFPDALAGAAFCGKNGSVLVLADDKAMGNASFPASYKGSMTSAYVFGGVSAVGNKTWAHLVCASA